MARTLTPEHAGDQSGKRRPQGMRGTFQILLDEAGMQA